MTASFIDFRLRESELKKKSCVSHFEVVFTIVKVVICAYALALMISTAAADRLMDYYFMIRNEMAEGKTRQKETLVAFGSPLPPGMQTVFNRIFGFNATCFYLMSCSLESF